MFDVMHMIQCNKILIILFGESSNFFVMTICSHNICTLRSVSSFLQYEKKKQRNFSLRYEDSRFNRLLIVTKNISL